MAQNTNSAAGRYVRFPFGEASVKSVVAAAVINVTTENSETIVEISQMAAAGTINVAAHPETEVGARLTVKTSANGTNRVLTLGTGLTGNAFTVTADKSACLTFVYDGNSYVNTGAILLN